MSSTKNKDMKDIHKCVICGRNLKHSREMVDTCGRNCYKKLLKKQRIALGYGRFYK